MSRALCIATASLSLAALVACGDSGDPAAAPSDSAAVETTAAGATTPSAATPADDVVEVVATGGLRFMPSELTAKVGVPFKGRLVQKGSIPHNIEIKELGVKGDETTTLEAGDTKPFSFTPSKAGTFTYVCTFHAQMKGTLTVS